MVARHAHGPGREVLEFHDMKQLKPVKCTGGGQWSKHIAIMDVCHVCGRKVGVTARGRLFQHYPDISKKIS
jgi:hypothetical protein